ncbi:MAG TPA: hypothetical protein VEY07_02175 [Thermoplasmata archaeon]|nr:hypothetical protein [Thermoplasmata archaeon]
MTYSTLKLCSGRGSFEATPRPKLSLDLAAIASRARGEGIPVTDVRVMLILGLDCETTLSRDGRILLKTGDPLVAGRAFDRLRGIAGLPAAEGSELPTGALPARVIPP